MTTMDIGLAERLTAATDEGVFETRMAEMVAPLVADRDQLLALREELKEGIAKIDGRIVIVDRLLRAAGQTQKEKGKNRTTNATAPKPSPASIEKAVRFLAEAENPLMTQEMGQALGVEPSSMQKQLKTARDLQLVRVAGRGGKTGKALLYATMPNAIERLDAGGVQWP